MQNFQDFIFLMFPFRAFIRKFLNLERVDLLSRET